MSKREATVRDFFDALNRDDATDLEVFDPDVEFNLATTCPTHRRFTARKVCQCSSKGGRSGTTSGPSPMRSWK
jgi:ketosteroid isomerase-like protein